MTPKRATGKKLYICHPLVGDGSPEWGNLERNLERLLAFTAYAMELGYTVLSYLHHVEVHRRGHRPPEGVSLHDYYLEHDEVLLAMADEVWVLCPQGVSQGVDREALFYLGMSEWPAGMFWPTQLTRDGITGHILAGETWHNSEWHPILTERP